MGRMTGVTLSFLGGASEIGASSTLVQVADTSILIDCGVRFRSGQALPDLDLLTGRRLDAIVVTHAHSDHTGALPVVHEAYPGVPIYMTPPTFDLVSILQRDALRLMDNASEREGEVPLYTERQVEGMLEAVRPAQHGDTVKVGEIEVRFLPASHILGASMIHLSTPAGNLLFTGDYSVSAQRTVPALDRPVLPVDWLVTESTYGNRLHADRRAAESRLVDRISEKVASGGRVLIPAFAIGRAQEVLLILKQALRDQRMLEVPIFVDGMVRAVCGVYARHERYVTRSLAHEIRRSGHPFFGGPIRAVSRPEERKEVLEAGPCVIVASSGMLSGGPSAYYAAELAKGEKDTILITGYQDEESPGRALLRLADQAGPRELRLGNRLVEVKCGFETYSLSGHADRMQMVGLIEALRPRTVTLVHGDREAKTALAESLRCRDLELAEDGRQLNRSYPVRRGSTTPPAPEALELTPEAAAGLLGASTGQPLPVDQLAAAWFGREVDAATREQFAQRVEQLGLARRDDHRRSLLWPLTPRARSASPGEEELALEQQLKLENPKGRLLELCMRLRIEPPRKLATTHEGRHVVELQVELEGEKYSSGIQRAHAEKLAEQLAAKELLAALNQRLEAGEAVVVSPTQAETLKLTNPKGRLLELCARLRLPRPDLEVKAVPGGFVGQACLERAGNVHRTAWFQAEQARVVEQAAAEQLLAELVEERSDAAADQALAAGQGAAGMGAPAAGEGNGRSERRDARMVLNEVRQQGWISDFGYELVDRRGPSHQPIFVVAAWAEVTGAGRRRGEPVEGPTMKEAQRRAAERLLEVIR